VALIDLGIPEQPGESPRRFRVPKHVVWGVIGLLLGAVAVGAADETTPSPSPPPRAVATEPPSPIARGLPDDASDLIAGANRQLSGNALGGVTVASLTSRLMAWPARDGAPRERTFRSSGAQPAGDYTLLLFCVGSGRVAVVLRVGSAIDTEIAVCADAAGASQLVLTRASGDVEVRMTALDAEDVAISAAVIRT